MFCGGKVMVPVSIKKTFTIVEFLKDTGFEYFLHVVQYVTSQCQEDVWLHY